LQKLTIHDPAVLKLARENAAHDGFRWDNESAEQIHEGKAAPVLVAQMREVYLRHALQQLGVDAISNDP
jgi:hypothetical protein